MKEAIDIKHTRFKPV